MVGSFVLVNLFLSKFSNKNGQNYFLCFTIVADLPLGPHVISKGGLYKRNIDAIFSCNITVLNMRTSTRKKRAIDIH